MKKKIGFLGGLILLSSCTSTYECYCVKDDQQVGYQEYKNVSRSKAVSNCKAYQQVVRLDHPGAICASPY